MEPLSEELDQKGYIMETLSEELDQKGYIIVRNLLNADEVEEYKKKIHKITELTDEQYSGDVSQLKGFKYPGGVAQEEELWPIIFHERLLSVLKEAIGPSVRFLNQSDIRVNMGNAGWHRDSADRIQGVGQDWNEEEAIYKVVRVGVFFQSYNESKSAFVVIPGSHKEESKMQRLEIRAYEKVMSMIPYLDNKNVVLPLLSAKPVWIKTEPGDAIFFNTRLNHTATGIQGAKISLFLCYGDDNIHSVNHTLYYNEKRTDIEMDSMPGRLVEQLKKAGLYLDTSKYDIESRTQ